MMFCATQPFEVFFQETIFFVHGEQYLAFERLSECSLLESHPGTDTIEPTLCEKLS